MRGAIVAKSLGRQEGWNNGYCNSPQQKKRDERRANRLKMRRKKKGKFGSKKARYRRGA